MNEQNSSIQELLDKLDILTKRQDHFSKEINTLREEIHLLKVNETKQAIIEDIKKEKSLEFDRFNETLVNAEQPEHNSSTLTVPIVEPIYVSEEDKKPSHIKENLEKFVGENLINKIGIAILIIGVAIGAKYAIDHDLISPTTRIILGYLMGLGLLGIAIWLKKKYENFSSVLLSGSMTIMYFITFAAYNLYELLPQPVAFGLMVVFTVFTVAAAISYNKQVIAHIGLVGAYAVPFLLSDGSGKVIVLFSYMTIINIGILFIAFRKYWKPLYYASFLLSWLIYLSWFLFNYDNDTHFSIGLSFLSIFFTIFYVMFLAYKLLQKEKFDVFDVVLLLANSFIFYGLGYNIFQNNEYTEQLLGVFTLCNAAIHIFISVIIYKQKLADRNLFYLVSGLALLFITIAIPVQLDGNWVTLMWAGEATLMFWIGRKKQVSFYEILSYALILLAFFCMVIDWSIVYNSFGTELESASGIPLFNLNFMTSLLCIASFGYINMLNVNPNYPSAITKRKELLRTFSFIIPGILLITLYFSFRLEIAAYWNQLYNSTFKEIKLAGHDSLKIYNSNLSYFSIIWTLNYSLLFFSILSLVNIKRIKNQLLGNINLGLNVLVLLVYLTQGLFTLSLLRDNLLNPSNPVYFSSGAFNVMIRYVSFVFVGSLLFAIYNYIRSDFLKSTAIKLHTTFDLMLHISLVWIISSELINWMDIMQSTQSYKLGLSIFWGVYSLFLIGLGIWKKKKHLRIGAIVLFGVTLIKLFIYDIAYLDTIAKTIVFVTLGILLLIISFLYNKYKNIISD